MKRKSHLVGEHILLTWGIATKGTGGFGTSSQLQAKKICQKSPLACHLLSCSRFSDENLSRDVQSRSVFKLQTNGLQIYKTLSTFKEKLTRGLQAL